MNSLLQNIVGCLALGLAVLLAGAQNAASVPQKAGEGPNADATPSAASGRRPAIDSTDKNSDASVAAEETAKSTSAARQETNPVANGEEVKIFRLKRADATASRDLVLEMYPAEFKNRSKIAADARTNTLVVRGPQGLLDLIEAVLLNLDESETARPEEKGARDPQDRSSAAGKAAQSRGAGARDNWVADLQTAADPDAEVARMKEEFRRQELQAADLARHYRQAQGAASPDDADLQKIKAALEGAVQAAFDARQNVQRYEAEQLRLRLTRIDARLTNRERVEKEIVRQRVEQLLHPDREWEPADDARSEKGAATSGGASADANQPLAPEYSKVRRLAADNQMLSVPGPGQPGRSSNPRKQVLDAEFAVSAARAKVDEEEGNRKFAQVELKRMRGAPQGSIPGKVVHEAERNVEMSGPRVKKARLELEHAEAQVHLARENLVSHRKLLELDLANAKLRVNHRAGDESRARQLIAKNAISRAEYEEKKLALEQAKLEIGRIQEQLDLYSKPIPGIGRATSEDQDLKQPAPEDDHEKPESGDSQERLR